VKFNPIMKTLYTDEGVLIKKLECPRTVRWSELGSAGVPGVNVCAVCERPIIDTDGVRDEAVLAMVRSDPATCLKVDLNQDNIRVVNSNE
jgi:hypothetical protein